MRHVSELAYLPQKRNTDSEIVKMQSTVRRRSKGALRKGENWKHKGSHMYRKRKRYIGVSLEALDHTTGYRELKYELQKQDRRLKIARS